MKSKLLSFINRVYVLIFKDKSTTTYGIFRVINMAIAPVSAILIIKYLNIQEQGYLYTMSSIVAISTYAELGLAQVITRMVTESYHQYLNNDSNGKIELFNYLKFTITAGLILFVFVLLISILTFLFFFQKKVITEPGLYLIFGIMSVTSSFAILVSLLNGFLDACNRNINTNYRRIIDSILRILILYIMLFNQGKLYAFAYSSLITTVISLLILIIQNFFFFKSICININNLEFDRTETFKVIIKRILPLQIKYAQTWATGIFVNAMIIPLVFYFQNESIAGRLGFSMALISIAYNISAIVINSQLPNFAMLRSQKKMYILQDIYIKRNEISIHIFIVLAFMLVSIIYVDKLYFHLIYSRITEISVVILLILANLFKLIVENKAMFVRSFKVEPFVKIAWIQALFSIIGMPIGTYYLGVIGTVIALLFGYIISYVSVSKVFLKYQNFI